MIKIAIVEDDKDSASRLVECLDRYALEKGGVSFDKRIFKDAVSFLSEYTSDYDIVFMDVDLPGMDGFKAAKKLRERDKEVALFFVTYLAQYAIRGYEFDAEDYILKPLKYESFALKLKKVLARIKTDTETSVLIKTTSGEFTFPSSSVIYAEISGHTIIYHTSDGDFEGYGTMKKVEEQLPKDTFFRCNSCYLVNLRYVSGIKGYTCVVGGYELKISHPRRKPFMEKLQEFYKNYSL